MQRMPLSARERTVVGLVLLLGLAVFLVPVPTLHEEHPPKEEDRYVRRVFADHTIGQRWQHDYAIDEVAILLRSNQEKAVDIVVEDEKGRPLAIEPLTVSPTEKWVRFPLSSPLPPGEHTLHWSAPALLQENEAVLIRFQADSTLYEGGEMIVDSEASYGDLAFQTYETVPLWQGVQIWGQITDKAARRGLWRLSVSVGLTLAVWLLGRWLKRWRHPFVWMGVPLLLLAIVTISIRAPYTNEIEGVFGGDAFNYLTKAMDLRDGKDPFVSDPRKAPLYSFLLLPGLWLPDPLLWSRWVGIVAATGAVILLPWLAYRLGLAWPFAVASGLFLAVNQEFTWEAPNGLANPLFAALIVAAALAFTLSATRRGLLALAVTCGLVPLTRYEGGIMSLVLLLAAWLRHRFSVKHLVLAVAIAGAIAGLPLSSYFISGVAGVRTPQDIAADEGLLLVQSAEDLKQNVELFAQFVRDSWLVEASNTTPVLPVWLAGLAIGGLLWALKRRAPERGHYWLQLACLMAVLAVTGVLLFTKSSPAHVVMAGVPLFLAGVGVVELLRRKPVEMSVLAVALVLHTLVIIFMLPKSRYFLPLIPFFALTLTAGLAALAQWPRARERTLLPFFIVIVLAVFFYHDSAQSLHDRLEWYNGKAHDNAVMVVAVKYIRQSGKRAAFVNKDEQPILVYVPPEQRFMFGAEGDLPIADQQLLYIEKNSIMYVVERNREPYWESVRTYPERFELVETFASRHGESKVLVYRVQ